MVQLVVDFCDGNTLVFNFYSDNQCTMGTNIVNIANGECQLGDVWTHTCADMTTQPTSTTTTTTTAPIGMFIYR